MSGERVSNDLAPIRVLAVDDHQLIRVGIATLLLPESDMKLVGEATNGREAIVKFRECRPDVTLMDLQMPEMSGFDAIIAIRDEFPGARIIVLTTYAGDAQAVRAMKAGAQGYLLKNLLHKELLQTIRAVHAGRKAMTPDVAAQLAEHSGEETLTPKEIDVLRLIAALPKWDSISMLLDAATDYDATVASAASEHVLRWTARYNRSWTAPTSEQLRLVRAALVKAEMSIELGVAREISFVLESWPRA